MIIMGQVQKKLTGDVKMRIELDSVGNYYASTEKKNTPNIFRISTTLVDKIDVQLLEKSLQQTIKYFPIFQTKLVKGFFWYHLEPTEINYIIKEEQEIICSPLSNNQLFRIHYFDNRINLEVSHIITDGLGSLTFFKTLLFFYLKYKYPAAQIDFQYLDENFIQERDENHYLKCNSTFNSPKKEKYNVYQVQEIKTKEITYFELHFETQKLIYLAKQYNTTITCFLISCFINSICTTTTKINQSIIIDVPVDLRKYFDSKTTRNFFAVTTIRYQMKKDNQFEDIIKEVNNQLKRNTSKEVLLPKINNLIKLEKNKFLSHIPLKIKNIILPIVEHINSKKITTSFSNLGKIDIPNQLKEYILDFNVLTTTNNFQFTTISYENDFSIGISHRYKNNNILKQFIRLLASYNLTITINTNYEGEKHEEMQ